MLSFKQFLIEKDVELYSWQPDYFLKDILDPKKRRPISVFSDQSQALAYPPRTAGNLIGPHSLLTGTTPTSNLRPDIEWNSGAYNQMFADLDARMKAGERPPTLMNPTKNPNFYTRFRDAFVTPGAAIQTDPVTGQKNIVAGWKPVLMEPQEVPGFDPRYVETGWENVSKPGVVPGIRKFNQKTGQYEDPIRWGGKATIPLQNEPDIMGFPETRQVDVLGRKTDVKKATETLLKKIEMGEFDPNKDPFSGFRVVDPKKVSLRPDGRTVDINPFKPIKIEGQPTQIPTKQATPSGARRAMSTRPTVSAIAAASGVGGMATGINAATDVSGILTPPPTTAVNKGVAKAASVLDPTDFATRNLKPGPAMVAGVAGGLAGDYIVKPAAEKAGVFDAVGRVSKAAFERMPPAAVDVADKALGAANYVLGGGPVDQLTTDAVKGVQSGMEGIMKDRAEQQKKTGRTNYSAPFGY